MQIIINQLPASLSTTEITRHFSSLGACKVTVQGLKALVSFSNLEGAFQALLQQHFAPLLQIPPEAIRLEFSVEVKFERVRKHRSRSRSPLRRETRSQKKEKKEAESSAMEVDEDQNMVPEPTVTHETPPKSEEVTKDESMEKDAVAPGIPAVTIEPTLPPVISTEPPSLPDPSIATVSSEVKVDQPLTGTRSEEAMEQRKEQEDREKIRSRDPDDDEESQFQVLKRNRDDGLTEIKCQTCSRKLFKKSWIAHLKTKTHTSQLSKKE